MDTVKDEVVIIGAAPGPFNIEGSGFGDSGQLAIGGVAVPTTKWSDTKIKGQLPAGISGIVELRTPTGVRTGLFGAKKVAGKVLGKTAEQPDQAALKPTEQEALPPAKDAETPAAPAAENDKAAAMRAALEAAKK